MKKILIPILLLLLVGVIIYFVVIESSSSRVENRKENQFEYSTEEFEDVEAKLVNYKETKQIQLSGDPRAIGWHNNQIYLLEDTKLKVINSNGKLDKSKDLGVNTHCLRLLSEGTALIGFKSHFILLDTELKIIATSDKENDKAHFTSIVQKDNEIFVADAGNRKILRYEMSGKKLSEFEGVSGAESLHGFIIPSPNFDMGVNEKNELWVVNPGMHTFQHYSPSGDLVRFWRKTSMSIEGFSGCCNPAHIAFLPNGNIVTSEKGMPRIKILDGDGKFVSVVAAPEKFDGDQAPDVVCDDQGNVYALDFDKKMIRVFMKI